jgi:hypothetical protein
MAFVREDVSDAPLSLAGTPRQSFYAPQWMGRVGALVLSLALQAIMIWMLLLMGVFPPLSRREHQNLVLLDIVAPAQSETGAFAAKAEAPVSPTSVPTKLDVAAPSELKPEWSMAKLPPLAQPTPTPPAATAPAAGNTSSGSANGDGFDPYSFASYQPEQVSRAMSAAALQPDREILARIEQALRQRLGGASQSISVAILVSRDGRVARAEVTSALQPNGRMLVRQALVGSALFARSAPKEEVQTTITLSI